MAAAFLLVVAWGPAGAAGPSIGETAARLRAIPVPEERDVPPEVSVLLTRFKQQIRDTMAVAVAGEAVDASASLVQQSILHALRVEGIGVDDDSEGYGSVAAIEVERPRREPDLLVITVELSIPCGNDTSLYLFQAGKLILAREAKPYDSIAGAQGSFSWGISPPDRTGHWFVVATNINPWCSSNWQTLRYEALRPGREPDSPRVVMQGESSIFLGDESFNLAVDAGSFTLSFTASQDLDVGILTREHVIRMRIDGDHAFRVEPIARTPEGFLDEWLGAQWTEVSRWSDPSLEEAHDELLATIAAGEKEDDFGQSLSPTVTCPGDREWIVELDLEPGSVWYFDIIATETGFRMLAASADEPLECGVVAVAGAFDAGSPE